MCVCVCAQTHCEIMSKMSCCELSNEFSCLFTHLKRTLYVCVWKMRFFLSFSVSFSILVLALVCCSLIYSAIMSKWGFDVDSENGTENAEISQITRAIRCARPTDKAAPAKCCCCYRGYMSIYFFAATIFLCLFI